MRGLPGVLHHCCSTFLKYIYSCLNLGNLISYMIYGPIMDREADLLLYEAASNNDRNVQGVNQGEGEYDLVTNWLTHLGFQTFQVKY